MIGSTCCAMPSRLRSVAPASTPRTSSESRRTSLRPRLCRSSPTGRRSAASRHSSCGRTPIPSCGGTTPRRSKRTGSRRWPGRGTSRGSRGTAAGSRRSGSSQRRSRFSRRTRRSMRRSTAGSKRRTGSSGSSAASRHATPALPATRGSSRTGAIPPRSISAALNPGFAGFVNEKVEHPLSSLGRRAGSLTAQAAAWTGLSEGIAVAVGNVDAHVTAPAARSIEPGHMLAVMGTSTCHVMNGTTLVEVPGMCGVVDGGITPGLLGYEAGQSGVGDIFGWFVERQVPPDYYAEAERRGVSVHRLLSELATGQTVGEHGLVALDWHSGNRSVLVDHELSGVLVGVTLGTRPEDIYRALDRSDRVRHAQDHRELRESRPACSRVHRGRRAAQEPTRDADLLRRAASASARDRVG